MQHPTLKDEELKPKTNSSSASKHSTVLVSMAVRTVYFLISFKPGEPQATNDMKEAKKWEAILKQKNYSAQYRANATSNDMRDAIQDPTTTAIIWSSHGTNGGIHICSNGERFWAASDGIHSKVPGNDLEFIQGITTVSKHLKFAVFYGCRVEAWSEEQAQCFEDKWAPENATEAQLQKAKKQAEAKCGTPNAMRGWRHLLKCQVFASPAVTHSNEAINPTTASQIGWMATWKTTEWNNNDLEKSHLLGGLKPR